jgi:hypothetical protein
MKQRTAAPQKPAVAYARAFGAFGMVIGGSFRSIGDTTTATNLSARRLGMRPT